MPAAGLYAQSFDNVFHLAAVRFIIDTGRASPWDIAALMRPGGESFFYPSGWHALAALVAEVASVPVVIASNACLLVIICVVWPLGAVLLTRSLFGGRTSLVIASGILAAGFTTYPFMLIESMGTYPLVASIALLPVPVAAAISVVRTGAARLGRRRAAIVVAMSLPALSTVHPSALVMFAVLTIPIALVVAVLAMRRHVDRRRLIGLLGVLYTLVVVLLVVTLRPGVVQPDALELSVAQAAGEVVLSAFADQPIPLVLAAALAGGVTIAVRRRDGIGWVALGLWAITSLLYIGTVAGDELVRLVVGGPWYVDAKRIAAFTPISIIPLAAAGVSKAWEWFAAEVNHRIPHRHGLRMIVTSTAIVVVATTLVQSPGVREIDSSLRSIFLPTDNALTSVVAVGPDERRLIDFIASTVPATDVIANNPRDGSGFIYPITGRHLLTAYMLTDLDEDRTEFYAGIAEADASDPACEVAERLNVRWVVQFHPHSVLAKDTRFDGIKDIADSPNVELVHKVGNSALYRITGCGFGDD